MMGKHKAGSLVAQVKAKAMSCIRFACFLLSSIFIVIYIQANEVEQALAQQQTLSLLHSFYNSTGGNTWSWFGPGNIWNFTTIDGIYLENPCRNEWQGICCLAANFSEFCTFGENSTTLSLNSSTLNHTQVIGINLPSKNLHGTLSSALFGLSFLEALDLSSNNLCGHLSPEIGNLAALEYINLSENQLSGTIPQTLSWNSAITLLSVGDNSFTGQLAPDLFQSMTNLSYLDLSANSFDGNITTWFENNIKISVLDLSHSGFSGLIPFEFAQVLGSTLSYLDLSYSSLGGCIPENFGNLMVLEYLNFAGSHFSCTLPVSMSTMQSLAYFDIQRNAISGDMLSVLAPVTSLVQIIVSDNLIFTPIPTAIWKLALLKNLDLSGTDVVGSLPTEICLLGSLESISLDENLLSGQLPTCLGELHAMTYFSATVNALNGTIPEQLALMAALSTLDLTVNSIYGSIPSSLGNLKYLQELSLGSNSLSQSLPSSLGALTNLNYVDLSFNYLDGIFPAEVGSCVELVYLSLNQNLMSGILPTTLGLMTNLLLLNLGENLFSGQIPSTVGNASALFQLFLSENLFTGILPTALGQLTQLGVFSGSSNYFSGTIPTAIGLLTNLEFGLYLYSNKLTGTIPRELGLLSLLEILDLHDNSLSMNLPTELTKMAWMQSLILRGNFLTGMPGPCFSANQTYFQTIDISDNSFTGTVPREIFQLPALQSISLIKNCFTGTLPLSMCSALLLETVAMDGLSSGEGCLVPLLLNSYTAKHFIQGAIPACLFALPQLQILQLSGNGLSSSLPAVSLQPILGQLFLSYNLLTGSIPLNIQQHSFQSLDLSHNRLSGGVEQMESFFDTQDSFQAELTLDVNRLSGLLPESFSAALSIQVVSGNLFGCSPHTGLPQHDPGSLNTGCGSEDLNDSLVVWICLAFAIIAVGFIGIFVRWCCFKQKYPQSMSYVVNLFVVNYEYMKTYAAVVNTTLHGKEGLARDSTIQHSLSSDSHMTQARLFLVFLEEIRLYAMRFAAVIIICFLPFELVIKYVHEELYSTHSVQYALLPSLAFISGSTPAIVFLTMISGFIIYCFASTNSFKPAQTDGAATVVEKRRPVTIRTHERVKRKRIERDLVILILFPLMDVALMMVINGCYLFVVFNQSATSAFQAQIALAAVKLAWNTWLLPSCLEFLQWLYKDSRISSRYDFSTGLLLTTIILCNNILVPVLTTMCRDPSCFYNAFIAAFPVDVSFAYSQNCFIANPNGECIFQSQEVVVSYVPPFMYSYQCSSSVLAYYVSVFVIMYIYLTFIAPLLCFVITVAHTMTSNPRIQALLDAVAYSITRAQHRPSEQDMTAVNLSVSSSPSNSTAMGFKIHRYSRSFMSADEICGNLVCHLLTLLTFGTAYPPLAILICAAICVESWQWTVLTGRYLLYCLNAPIREQELMLQRLEMTCTGIAGMLTKSKWLLLGIMVLFFSFFLFDIAGDKAGNSLKGVIWAPLTLACVGLFVRICYSLVKHWWRKNPDVSRVERPSSTRLTYSVELSTQTATNAKTDT